MSKNMSHASKKTGRENIKKRFQLNDKREVEGMSPNGYMEKEKVVFIGKGFSNSKREKKLPRKGEDRNLKKKNL